MTITTDLASLTANVVRLNDELANANADVAWFNRLKDAEANAKRIAVELEEAQAHLTRAMADEVEAKTKSCYAQFSGIRVETVSREGHTSPLSNTYTVVYSRLTYDMNERQSLPKEHRCSINNMPPEVYGYLMDVHPEAIPAAIANLAPGNPTEAMDTYFMGMQRGYLRG